MQNTNLMTRLKKLKIFYSAEPSTDSAESASDEGDALEGRLEETGALTTGGDVTGVSGEDNLEAIGVPDASLDSSELPLS